MTRVSTIPLHGATSRSAAIQVTANKTYEQAETLGREKGHKVSRATLERTANKPAGAPSKRANAALVDFAVDDLCEEIAADLDVPLSEEMKQAARDWFVLINLDNQERDLSHDDQFFEEAANQIKEIIARHSKSESFLECVVCASARLHLARNPTTSAGDKASQMQTALSVLTTRTRPMLQAYQGSDIEPLLSGDDKAFASDYRTDTVGLLCSTALHLIAQTLAAHSVAGWRDYIAKLDERRLLPLMLVRGVYFKDTEPLINAAEAAWAVGDENLMAATLRYAKSLDPTIRVRFETVWAPYLDLEFVEAATLVLGNEV